MKTNIYEAIAKIVGNKNVLSDEPMRKHITFRVGGNADYYVTPENEQQIVDVISYCRKLELPYYIIGNGSNLLVRDEGFSGVIIEIGSKYNKIQVEENKITAKAGAILARVAAKALEKELTGMEFAHGIPGTLGGAITMNAGAYGGEMKDILESVKVLNAEGEIWLIKKEDLDLSYRHSIVSEKNYTVLEAVIALKKGKASEIKNKMDELSVKRKEKQPLEYPSAGSTFKRPEGYFAGKLIEDAGLKGYRVGGAMVSEKHSGFVINYDNASCQDVIQVIKDVQKIVKEKYGVSLETEVKIL